MSRCLVGVLKIHLVHATATGSASILCAKGLVRSLLGPAMSANSRSSETHTHTAISCPEMAAELAEPADLSMRPARSYGGPEGERVRQPGARRGACRWRYRCEHPPSCQITACRVTAKCTVSWRSRGKQSWLSRPAAGDPIARLEPRDPPELSGTCTSSLSTVAATQELSSHPASAAHPSLSLTRRARALSAAS